MRHFVWSSLSLPAASPSLTTSAVLGHWSVISSPRMRRPRRIGRSLKEWIRRSSFQGVCSVRFSILSMSQRISEASSIFLRRSHLFRTFRLATEMRWLVKQTRSYWSLCRSSPACWIRPFTRSPNTWRDISTIPKKPSRPSAAISLSMSFKMEK